MTFPPRPAKLSNGAFFGNRHRSIETPSFHFGELQATVPEKQVPRHTHDSPHFILVTAGTYVTEARNRSGVCGPGTFIFNPGGTTHRDRFRSSTGSFLSISPRPEAVGLMEGASPVPLMITSPEAPELNSGLIAGRIVREFLRCGSTQSPVLEGIGLELIGMLCGIEESSWSRFVPTCLHAVRQMIDDSLTRELTIAELAQFAGVHPVYLARAHRRYFGCSPGEYLRSRRLLRVRGLLSETDMPLVEVALQSGFSDQCQMTRWFSQMYGVSPGRYRRMSRS